MNVVTNAFHFINATGNLIYSSMYPDSAALNHWSSQPSQQNGNSTVWDTPVVIYAITMGGIIIGGITAVGIVYFYKKSGAEQAEPNLYVKGLDNPPQYNFGQPDSLSGGLGFISEHTEDESTSLNNANQTDKRIYSDEVMEFRKSGKFKNIFGAITLPESGEG